MYYPFLLLAIAYASWGALGLVLATAISTLTPKKPLNPPTIAASPPTL